MKWKNSENKKKREKEEELLKFKINKALPLYRV